MIVIGIAMLVIVTAAGLLVTYVAYPQRGREVPRAPWLGEAMTRAAVKVGVHDDAVRSDRQTRH